MATGIAAMARRQIRALAKSSMWKNKLLGAVLTGMGQIPIERGSGDSGALDRAIEELRKGACIGIYPEGTRSLGRALRARGGVGYMARAVPEATIVGVACNGTVAIPRFPRARPHVRVEFLRVRSTRDRARGVTAAVQHPAARSAPSACTDRGRGPQARRSARRPRPHLVPGAGDYGQARSQGRARGGARSDLRGTRLVSCQPPVRRPQRNTESDGRGRWNQCVARSSSAADVGRASLARSRTPARRLLCRCSRRGADDRFGEEDSRGVVGVHESFATKAIARAAGKLPARTRRNWESRPERCQWARALLGASKPRPKRRPTVGRAFPIGR